MTTVRSTTMRGCRCRACFGAHINGDRTPYFEFRRSGWMVQDFGASIAGDARRQRRGSFNAEMLAYRLMRRRSQHGCWAAGVIGENRRNGRNRNVMTVWSVHKPGPSQRRADEVQCGSGRQKTETGPKARSGIAGSPCYSGPMLVQLFAALACFCRTGSCGRYLPLLTSRDMAYSPHQGPAAQ